MIVFRRLTGFSIIGLLCMIATFYGCPGNDAERKVESASADQPPPLTVAEGQKEAVNPPAPVIDGKSPKIEFASTQHDFGKQVSGPELKYSFGFRNTGEGTLIIESVKAG